MSDDIKKLDHAATQPPVQSPHDGFYTKEQPSKKNLGRPPGSVNRLTREMQDAVISAAEELGHVDFDKWAGELKGNENGLKAYYKALAVKEMRTFGIILARMMPKFVHRTSTEKKKDVILTEEQVLAELKEAGLPLEIIKHMRKVDVRTIETSSLDYDPYEDPEEDEMVDVTPKDETK
jgi:hypothetical protein